MTALAVFTTVGTLEEARRLARAVVERKLAACAQLSTIESFYVWRGSIQHEDEVRILFKTTDMAYEALERTIRELHSYELPAIHAVRFDRILAPYAEWIAAHSTSEATGPSPEHPAGS
jgi:periplasmic divalent cation tolerance protein